MGCTDSKEDVGAGAFGPTKEAALRAGVEETLGNEFDDEDVPTGWPYEASRLKEVDWEPIVEDGEPWTDPDFPPGAGSLFINGESHREAGNRVKRRKWESY